MYLYISKLLVASDSIKYEAVTSKTGLTTATLYQIIKHSASFRNSDENTETHKKVIHLHLESDDLRFKTIFDCNTIHDFNTYIEASSKEFPPQRYVTKRPVPMARLFNKSAGLSAEVWSPDPHDQLKIGFIPSKAPTILSDKSEPIYAKGEQYKRIVEVEGVNVTVREEQIVDFTKYIISLHSQIPGLVVMSFAAMAQPYHLGEIIMFSEVILKS